MKARHSQNVADDLPLGPDSVPALRLMRDAHDLVLASLPAVLACLGDVDGAAVAEYLADDLRAKRAAYADALSRLEPVWRRGQVVALGGAA